jgi:hypothetical protein
MQAEFVPGEDGFLPQLEYQENSDQHHRSGEQKCNQPRDFVSVAQPAQK